MGNVRSLQFADLGRHPNDVCDGPDDFYDYYHPMLTNMDSLLQYLVAPLRWEDIEQENEAPAELSCARVLSDLLVALHNAGVFLTELNVAVAPLYSNFSMLRPRRSGKESGDAWGELGAACQNPRFFEFSGGNPT